MTVDAQEVIEGIHYYTGQPVEIKINERIIEEIIGIVNPMEFTGCALGEAIQMASTNPARFLHVNDRGVLEPGKRADIILFTLDDFQISIQET